MDYRHILSYVARTPWAILPEKMDEILAVLAFRSAGHAFTPGEIQARIGGGPATKASAASGAVAVIPLRGVIAHRMGSLEDSSGGQSAERFTKMVQQATADPSIDALVLDVDSPGGTVAGLVEAADAVFTARKSKRVMAVANATMASAAYWIASQADTVVAIPSALDRGIGSIGVFAVHQDLSAALEKEGVKVTLIKSGANKAEGNPFEPLSDETRAQIQASVDAANRQFIKAVARGRGVSMEHVTEHFGEGRAFNAKDALKVGLIDRIATFEDAVAQAASGMRAEVTDPAPIMAASPRPRTYHAF